jgi:hypothetical protein
MWQIAKSQSSDQVTKMVTPLVIAESDEVGLIGVNA